VETKRSDILPCQKKKESGRYEDIVTTYRLVSVGTENNTQETITNAAIIHDVAHTHLNNLPQKMGYQPSMVSGQRRDHEGLATPMQPAKVTTHKPE
jgi:hypothetical protein